MRAALLIQHATRMRHIVTSFVAPLAPPYFSTLSHFREKVTEHKMCVLIFSTTFVQIFLILRRTLRDIVINVIIYSCKVPFLIVGFLRNWNFLDSFWKTQISSLIKIFSVRAELFHAGGRTNMTKLIVAFRNFSNAPKNTDFFAS